MTKKHYAELTEVARQIYDNAAETIQTYIAKTYGSRKENTLSEQLEDFHTIADEVAAYLMGNAIAMIDEPYWDEDLKTLNQHVKQIATFVASNQRAELSKKN